MALLSLVRTPTRLVAGAARTVAGLAGDRRSESPGEPVTTDRVAVDAPGVGRPEAADYRAALCAALRQVPGVSWAVVNAPLQRVVLGVTRPAPTRAQLAAVVRAVREQHPEIHGPADRPPPPDHPGAIERAATALVADAAGLVVATFGRIARHVPGAVEAASLITFVDTQPKVRSVLERALGRDRTDSVLALSNAAAQGLVGGVAGLGLDAALRISQLAEARVRRDAWRAEPALLRTPQQAAADPVVTERPCPVPDGIVERYAPRSVAVGAGAAGVALAAGGAGRAAAIAVAGLPKAPGIGREAFAAQLGRTLAGRRAHVMDPRVLRLLDRVDTVILDLAALTTGRLMVQEVHPLPGADEERVRLQAHRLFSAEATDQPVEQGGWHLGPIGRLRLHGRTGARERQRLQREGAVHVIGLARNTRLEALVSLVPQPAGSADALIAAARRSGARLVFAGGRPRGAEGVDAGDVPGRQHLLGNIRELQADGHVVLLVSDQPAALAGADVGIGVNGPDSRPPWGAHVLAGDVLEAAALLIDAINVARRVGRHGVRLAESGSAIGAITTITGSPGGAAGRALLAVNGAAALSLVQGVWAAAELARRPISPPVSSTAWHALPTGKVLKLLHSTGNGLTAREAPRRHRPDVQITPPAPSLMRSFAEELANPLTPILAGGAALSAAIGSLADAGIVLGASALGAVVGAVQKTVTDRAVADLLARSAVMATVRRDGRPVRLPADQLVPGDVVVLAPGDVMPADCRLIEAQALEMDESSLTGESMPVAKSTAPVLAADVADRACMVYEGTTVTAGRAVGVVVATGAATEAGRSMATAAQAAPASGVEARLGQITHTTLPIALGSGAAVMAAGLLRGRPVKDTIGAGVGLAVASVPEGLPFLVSAAQLAAARRLSRQGALVRNARTIEALGRVDVLCFDKTGTLTQGHIRLAAVADADTIQPVHGLDPAHRAVLAAGLRATPAPAAGQPLPHLTDRAVRGGAESVGIDESVGAPGWRLHAALPFEPSRGYHATAATTTGGHLLSVKGAPELVLARCTTLRADAGEERPLTGPARRRVRQQLDRLTRQGFRVLAVAETRRPVQGDLTDDDVAPLCFLGFLALADPVRTTAGASLDELRTAGAQIVMITGDHPATAETIAGELGLLNSHRVVTGADIDALDDRALRDLVPDIAVVARGTPAHKVRVVQAFQANQRVVAMTGDGANDAPAIRLADVGIALGQRGTPAARAAADLVVTDDRLETIIAALVEGRAMWRAVREALGILVGGNLGEIGFTVLGAAVTGASPLNARQLLLVNLLTDLAPALAVALRRPDPGGTAALLSEGPEASLGAALTRDVTLRAAATTIGATGAWIAAATLTGRGVRARTVALAALVGTQLGQTLLVGQASPGVLVASLGSAAVLAGVIQTPGLSQFFGCTPLGPVSWGIAVTAATTTMLGSAVAPAVERRLPPAVTERLEAALHPDRLADLAGRLLPAHVLGTHHH
ncbi:HAD-IC family P-type ATPase [Dactylosporangium sp. CA-139066]|uniref:cation-translocating P-type ATPase n=1 Tax=Dactylosporangium sp. CA-139066 TaxID=3239930 RepID=UPI003D916E25